MPVPLKFPYPEMAIAAVSILAIALGRILFDAFSGLLVFGIALLFGALLASALYPVTAKWSGAGAWLFLCSGLAALGFYVAPLIFGEIYFHVILLPVSIGAALAALLGAARKRRRL